MTLELVAVPLTLIAVYLTARQVVWCWPLNIVSAILYAVVFFEARLYADAGLQVLYFGLAVYGWWAWLHGGEHHGELRVTTTPAITRAVIFLAAAAAGVLLGQTLTRLTNASLPILDSLLTSFSIAAQWMQTRKLLESWLVWLVVDMLYVGMFLYKELFLTAALYAVFLGLATMGFVEWRRSMGTPPLPAASEVSP